jgi:integrase
MANVIKRTSSSGTTFYQCQWHITLPDGTRKQRTKAFNLKRDAEKHAADMLDIERKGVIDTERFTVRSFLIHWIAEREQAGEIALDTLRGNRYCANLINEQIGDIALVKLQPIAIERAYRAIREAGGKDKRKAHKGERVALSPQTVRHVHRMLVQALGQAVRWRYISNNPAFGLKTPKVMDAVVKLPERADIARIIEAAQYSPYPYAALAIRMFVLSGVRRGELLGMSVENFDPEGRTIEIIDTVVLDKDKKPHLREARMKTAGSRRVITLPAEFIPVLLKHKAALLETRLKWGKAFFKGPLLMFPGPAGMPLAPNWFTKELGRVMKKAGVKGVVACHAYRHFSATELLTAGLDIKQVSSRLGHTTPMITLKTYAHATKERDEKAAAMLADTWGKITAVLPQKS